MAPFDAAVGVVAGSGVSSVAWLFLSKAVVGGGASSSPSSSSYTSRISKDRVGTEFFDEVPEPFLVVLVTHVDCALDCEFEVLAGARAGDVRGCAAGASNAGVVR
jgi:hypothetical protein